MSGLLARNTKPALPAAPTDTSASYVKLVNAVSIASALAPLAEAGTVLNVPLRADQLPPYTVQRWFQVEPNCSEKEPAVGDGVPRYGNQLTRMCCAPNGTKVTVSTELVEATGLDGGSKACVPSQPIVQSGSRRAWAINLTEGSAGSNGFVGVVKLVKVKAVAGLAGSNWSA